MGNNKQEQQTFSLLCKSFALQNYYEDKKNIFEIDYQKLKDILRITVLSRR